LYLAGRRLLVIAGNRGENVDDFNQYIQRPMTVFPFVFANGQMGALKGSCRGKGPMTEDMAAFEYTVGIYTSEGSYYFIVIDERVQCAAPTFGIDGKNFFYPVVRCATSAAKVDPMTGTLAGTNPEIVRLVKQQAQSA
jgi:hypothetical protein